MVDLASYGGFEHPLGFPGQLYNLANAMTIDDAPAKIMDPDIFLTYGVPIIRNDDGSVSKLTSAGDIAKLAGITLRYVNRVQDALTGKNGWRDRDVVPFLSQGFIYVAVSEAVKAGDDVYFDPEKEQWGKTTGIKMNNDYIHWRIPSDTTFDDGSGIAGLKLGYGL